MANSFQTFAYFVICISTLSCNTDAGGQGRIGTVDPLTSEEMVEKRIKMYDKYLAHIEDVEVRAEFKGVLKELARRVLLADQLLKTEGGMQQKIEEILRYTKSLACGKNIRYGLETFKNHYLLSPTESLQARKKIIDHMRDLFKNRRKTIRDMVYAIAYYVPTTTSNEKLQGIVQKLKDLIKVPKVDSLLTNDVEEFDPEKEINLTTAIFQLCQAEKLEDIIKIRKNQVDFWGRFELSSNETIFQIDSLCRNLPDEIIKEYLWKGIEISSHQFFASETFQLGRILNDNINEMYLDCTWVTYTSQHPDIKSLRSKRDQLWPNIKNNAEKTDRLCNGFSVLYTYLSLSIFHSPDLDKLPKECRPETEDYVTFVNSITGKTDKSSDLPGIALIVAQLTLPTTTITTKENSNSGK